MMATTRDQNEGRRTVWGRILRYLLGPIYYHLGVLDRYGRPSNAKIVYTAAFAVNLIFVMIFGAKLIASTSSLSAIWAWWAGATMAFAGGHQVFKDYLDKRGGGIGDAAVEAAKAEVQALARVKTEHFDE